MRRRSRSAGQSVQSLRRKAATSGRRDAPKAVRRRGSSPAGQETKTAQPTRELNEAREQQAATAEILRLISSSPTGVQPVFDTIVRNFVSLCGSVFGSIYTFDGELVHFAGSYGFSPEQLQAIRTKYPVRVDDRSVLSSRAILAKAPLHIRDIKSDPDYDRAHAAAVSIGRLLAVPLLRDGAPLGVIVAGWAEPGPTPKQHEELLKVFADQAVIAIENTRLLNELRQRTGDLSEALEQQTATSDILGVISSSPGELQAVFDIILKNANRLCDAKFSALFIYENGLIRVPSHADLPPPLAEHFHKRNNQPPIPGTAIETLIRTKRLIHIPDQRGSPEGLSSPATTLAGARTYLAVPLLKDGNVIGAIATFRQEVRPFTDKQIQLVQNFASQTVIAIENARLLNELRERTADLTESLEQQTATSEVLRVISSSSGNLQTVFDTMLTEATDLCEASYGLMWLREEDAFRAAALYGDLPQAYRDQWRSGTRYRPGPETILSRVTASGRPIQVPDLRIDPSYLSGDPLPVAAADVAGVRTLLGVPMLRDTEVVGFIGIYR